MQTFKVFFYCNIEINLFKKYKSMLFFFVVLLKEIKIFMPIFFNISIVEMSYIFSILYI